MSGILGRLFREFAVTITAAILISGVVSITLTPMLCSRFLRVVHTKKGLAGLLDRAFDAVFDGYKWSLGLVLRHRVGHGRSSSSAVLAGHGAHGGVVPKGFIPDQDNDFAVHQPAGGAGHVVPRHGRRGAAGGGGHPAEPVRRQLHRQPGGGGNYGGGGSSERADPGAAAAARAASGSRRSRSPSSCGRLLLRFPNYRGFVNLPAGAADRLRRSGNSSYNVTVQSADTDQLYAQAQPSEHGDGDGIPEIRTSRNDLEIRSPQREPGRSIATRRRRVGLNATQIQNALSDRLRPEVVVHDLRRHDAVPRARRARSEVPAVRRTRSTSSRSRRRAAARAAARLVVSMQETVGPQSINHSGQLPSVSVSFGLRPGVVARRRRRPHPAGRGGQVLPRDGDDRASRARPRSSRSPRRTSGCCSSSPSASSTSCWARCTRATSTRSRFSRACRRPAWARSSRSGCSATS